MGDWHTNPVVWIGAITAFVIAGRVVFLIGQWKGKVDEAQSAFKRTLDAFMVEIRSELREIRSELRKVHDRIDEIFGRLPAVEIGGEGPLHLTDLWDCESPNVSGPEPWPTSLFRLSERASLECRPAKFKSSVSSTPPRSTNRLPTSKTAYERARTRTASSATRSFGCWRSSCGTGCCRDRRNSRCDPRCSTRYATLRAEEKSLFRLCNARKSSREWLEWPMVKTDGSSSAPFPVLRSIRGPRYSGPPASGCSQGRRSACFRSRAVLPTPRPGSPATIHSRRSGGTPEAALTRLRRCTTT